MHTSHLRALVVNDLNLARWALSQALTGAGFEVSLADTIDAALSAIGSVDALDVLVAPLTFPHDGVERLMDGVRDRWPAAAVILLATDVDPHVPTRAENRAIVLDTPFSVDDIVAAASRLLPAVSPRLVESAVSGPLDGIENSEFRIQKDALNSEF